MKRLFVSLLLLSGVAFSTAPTSDVMTTVDAFRLNRWMGPVALQQELGTKLLHSHTTAYGVLDLTAVTGQSGANGTLNVGILLPNKAVLRQVWFDVVTAIAPAGVSVSILVNADQDIKATTAAGSWTGVLTSLVTGAPSTFLKMTAASNIAAVLTGSTATAGKVKIFADYAISE